MQCFSPNLSSLGLEVLEAKTKTPEIIIINTNNNINNIRANISAQSDEGIDRMIEVNVISHTGERFTVRARQSTKIDHLYKYFLEKYPRFHNLKLTYREQVIERAQTFAEINYQPLAGVDIKLALLN